jgi:hypothetical protein
MAASSTASTAHRDFHAQRVDWGQLLTGSARELMAVEAADETGGAQGKAVAFEAATEAMRPHFNVFDSWLAPVLAELAVKAAFGVYLSGSPRCMRARTDDRGSS